jgi:hypothetical protein
VDEVENPAWRALTSQATEMRSQAGISLDESLRCHEVLDSFDHEKSLTFDWPIFSQGRCGLHGLPDLQHVDLGTLTDAQLAVSIFFVICFCGAHMLVMTNLIMSSYRHATGVADLFTGKLWQLAGAHVGRWRK